MKTIFKLILPAAIIVIFWGCNNTPLSLSEQFLGNWDVVSLDYLGTTEGDYSSADLTTDPAETRTAKIILSNTEFSQYNKAEILKLKYSISPLSSADFKSTVSDAGISDAKTGDVFYWKAEADPHYSDQILLYGYASTDSEMQNALALYICKPASGSSE